MAPFGHLLTVTAQEALIFCAFLPVLGKSLRQLESTLQVTNTSAYLQSVSAVESLQLNYWIKQ